MGIRKTRQNFKKSSIYQIQCKDGDAKYYNQRQHFAQIRYGRAEKSSTPPAYL